MIPIRQGRLFGCTFLVFIVGVAGCRDTKPPPAHNRDLGGDGVVLLPTGSAWHDPGIAKGKADWHPFREPQPAATPGTDDTAADDAPAGNAEVEVEIRELIDDYNDLVVEAAVDDLLEYYVDDQQDAMRPLLESMLTLTAKLDEVCKALEAKLPDAKERISKAFETLESSHSARLPLESLAVVSDTEVTGTITSHPEPMPCRFLVVDDEWFIELQGFTPYAEAKPVIDATLAGYEALLQALQSGQTPPKQVLSGIEQAANMVAASTGQGTQESTGGDAPGEDLEPASTESVTGDDAP